MAAISRAEGRQLWVAYLMVAPVVALLVGLLIWPWLVGAWTSLTDMRIGRWGDESFVGLQNYISVLRSGAFWSSLRTTAVFGALCVTVEMGLGLGLALLLNRSLPDAPSSAPSSSFPSWCRPSSSLSGASLEAKGVVNYLLVPRSRRSRGCRAGPARQPGADRPVADDAAADPLARCAADGAKDVYEALGDGASAWQTFWRVTLPMIAPLPGDRLPHPRHRAAAGPRHRDGREPGRPANSTMVLHLLAYRETFIGGFGYGTSTRTCSASSSSSCHRGDQAAGAVAAEGGAYRRCGRKLGWAMRSPMSSSAWTLFVVFLLFWIGAMSLKQRWHRHPPVSDRADARQPPRCLRPVGYEMRRAPAGRYFANSLLVVGGALAATMVLGTMRSCWRGCGSPAAA